MAAYTKLQKDFVRLLYPYAVACQRKYNVPWQVMIAQAINESGWGQYKACGSNYFGIKAQKGEPFCYEWTYEYRNGQRVRVQEPFKKYNSVGDALNAHALFLVQNSRYAPAFKTKSPKAFLKAVADAGYAGEPTYYQIVVPHIDDAEQIVKELGLKPAPIYKPGPPAAVNKKGPEMGLLEWVMVLGGSALLGYGAYRAITHFRTKRMRALRVGGQNAKQKP